MLLGSPCTDCQHAHSMSKATAAQIRARTSLDQCSSFQKSCRTSCSSKQPLRERDSRPNCLSGSPGKDLRPSAQG